MRVFLATTCLLIGALLAGGCATKKYVRNTTAPIQAKVDQVGEQTNRNGQQIEDTRNQVKQLDDKTASGISSATERANSADQHAASADQHAATADQHAGEAMKSATAANQLGEQNSSAITSLRGVITNIDDYKLQTSVAVPFGFNRYTLTDESKDDLDKLADQVKADKRFFIAVEGYTDSSGSKAYNEALSGKRADSVVHYLVSKHDIPIYRIHMIGLGMEKPVDEAHNRAARAKNRRVEVKVFSADQVTAGLNSGNAGAGTAASRNQQ
jgi:outer membrane protein OmpA-like peptidoglycan-associated protein